MRKKVKTSASGKVSNGLKNGIGMMTEQEQRLYHKEQSHTRNANHSQTGHKVSKDDQIDELTEIRNLSQGSAEEITQFINKLIAKNKISSKNAFDIPLIHLEEMEDYRSSLNEHTWKRLSSTLQNDYKIYGYRVDAAHNITYKMVQSIARHESANDQNFGTSQMFRTDSQAVGSNSQKNKYDISDIGLSKSKLNVDYLKFIEKNLKLINVNQIETFFNYNPGLQRTKRKFDQQGLKGLLLSNIPIRQNGELKLDDAQIQQTQVIKQQNQQQLKYGQYIQEVLQKQFNQNKKKQQGRSQMQIENEGQKQNQDIFNIIEELNINSGGIKDKDEFKKIQRLYGIISGLEAGQLQNQKKTKETIDSQEPKVGDENEQAKSHPIQQEAKNIIQSQQPQSIIPNDLDQPNMEQNVSNNGQVSQFQPNIIDQNIINAQNLINVQMNQNPFTNKVFDLMEVRIDDNEEQSVFNEEKQGQFRMVNIESYISLNSKHSKKQKRGIAQSIDTLSADQIGEKLFNRKIIRKKNIRTKDVTKQESNSQALQKKKISFRDKLLNSDKSSYLKRSVVFKKTLSDERSFNEIKSKIQQRLEKEEKLLHKIKKDKHTQKNYRLKLNLYDFRKQDVNVWSSMDLVDIQSHQITFPQYYTEHFPSFIEELTQFKDKQKVKELFLQAESKRKIQQQQALQMKLQNNNDNQIQNQANQNNQVHNQDSSFQQNKRSSQQVTIRQAKDSVKSAMARCLKKRKSKNQKITFNQVYRQYTKKDGYISPALCFLTILHLANQHNLVLQGEQYQKDFKIYNQDKDSSLETNFTKENQESILAEDQNESKQNQSNFILLQDDQQEKNTEIVTNYNEQIIKPSHNKTAEFENENLLSQLAISVPYSTKKQIQ